jgi:putative membrane protein
LTDFLAGLWTPDPGVVDGLLAFSVLYALAVGPGRRYLAPGEPFEKKRAASFVSGVVILILAVATPLDHIGETYLFSVHMVQHVILMFVFPPFLILGTPPWLADFLFRTEGLGRLLRWMVKPVVAGVLFNLVLILWHFPAFYELALRDPLVHLLEHASFIAVSISMYWVLVGQDNTVKPVHNGVKLLYVLAVTLGQIPLFGVLAFSPTVLYPTYAAAPRYYPDLSPIADQVLGGVIMKLVAAVFMFTGLVVYFYRWYQSEEAAGRARPSRARTHAQV